MLFAFMPRKTIYDIQADAFKKEADKFLKDNNISNIDTNNINMNQSASLNDGDSSNCSDNKLFKRISVNISTKNLEKLRKYQQLYNTPIGTKASELLNKAIEDMQFASN